MNFLHQILKDIDLFSIHISFYIDQKKQYYTRLGGILTIISFIISILVFVYIIMMILYITIQFQQHQFQKNLIET